MNFENCRHSHHFFKNKKRKINEIEYDVVLVNEKEEKTLIKRDGKVTAIYFPSLFQNSHHFYTYPNMPNCLGILLELNNLEAI
jgi:hypothetical protein